MNPRIPLLAGKQLWGWGRAADLISFQIGTERMVVDGRGHPKTVGEFALHIQCPWRMTRNENLIVGSGDLCCPPDGSDPQTDFDWDVAMGNRCDVILGRLFYEKGHLVIESVELQPAGILQMLLTDSIRLELFPDASADREHWRLFEPYTERPHTIAKGTFVGEDSE